MWIERRAGRRLSSFADAAAPRAQRRSGGIWSPNHGWPATAPRRHCGFHTGDEPILLNETVASWRAASPALLRHPRESGDPVLRSYCVGLDSAIGAGPIF